MSEAVYCDCCGAEGRRRRGFPAPADWLYLEAKDDSDPNPEETTIIVYACSMACAAGLWRFGPGPKMI